MRRLAKATALAFSMAVLFSIGQTGSADGGDFSMDFTAAEPSSYDHSIGGGSYNFRNVNTDIVESLEGGDFACGDLVTFLTQITVDAGATGTQAIRLHYEFTAHSTGQQGVALVDNNPLGIGNGESAAINPNPPDAGTSDGGAAATAAVEAGSEFILGTQFEKPATFFRSVNVGGLDPGDTIVLRTDVRIACNGDSPTGNMQARLASAEVISPVADAISSGDQTIPFKHVGDICDPKTEVCK